MSDIPIGSPPVPPGRHAAPGGWYPDPVDPTRERYWDGWQWSRNTRPNERAARPPVPGPAPTPPPPGYGPTAGQPPYPPHQPPYPAGPAPAYPASYPPAGAKQILTADGVPLSGWWWRVLAMIIDNLIVGVVAALLASPIYVRVFTRLSEYINEAVAAAQAGLPPPPQPPATALIPLSDQLILTGIALVVEAAYILTFLRWKSATPGKLICGLRVVPVDQGRFAGPLPWNTIVVRTAVWVLPAISIYLAIFRLLDALFPLWHPKRQALHDLAARTQVIKIR